MDGAPKGVYAIGAPSGRRTNVLEDVLIQKVTDVLQCVLQCVLLCTSSRILQLQVILCWRVLDLPVTHSTSGSGSRLVSFPSSVKTKTVGSVCVSLQIPK